MSDNERGEAAESDDEEMQEAVMDCNVWNLSEFFGTDTVKDFPQAKQENVDAANAAYNKTQTRGV